MGLRPFLKIMTVAFFLLPFFILLAQFDLRFSFDREEVFWAFKNSFYQAFFSALGSLFFGFLSTLALLSLQEKGIRSLGEILCLLPNFLPPLFTLIAVLNFVDPFPMGIFGISLVHIFMNFGLVAVLILSIIESRMGGWVELAWLEGASYFQFMTSAILPSLKKDLLGIFLFVFTLCFSSFSIPLVVGGGSGTTVEVLIYEKIRISADWGSAIWLCLLQAIFIFILSLVVTKNHIQVRSSAVNISFFRNPFGYFCLILWVVLNAVLLKGFLSGFWDGFLQSSQFWAVRSILFKQTLGTILLGLGGGLICFLFLFWTAFLRPQAWFHRFLNGYMGPSSAMVGLTFLVVSPNDHFWPWIKIPLAFVVLYYSTLYRLSWGNNLSSLQSQRNMAEVLGANNKQIFWKVEFPQLLPKACFLTGLFSVWLMGDFALSRILAPRDLSLAMATQTLLSSYRINQASFLSFFVFLLCLFVFLFWMGVGRVLRRKFKL